MLSYKKFKELVPIKLSGMIKQDYSDVVVQTQKVIVGNQLKSSLWIVKNHGEDSVGASILFSDLYMRYIQDGDFDYTMDVFYKELHDSLEEVIKTSKETQEITQATGLEDKTLVVDDATILSM